MPYDSARQQRFMHTKTGREKAPGLAERYDQEIRDARKRKGRTVAKSMRYGNGGGVGRRIQDDDLVEKALVSPAFQRRLASIVNRGARSGSLGSGIPNHGVAEPRSLSAVGRHRSTLTDATPAYAARLRRNARQGRIGVGEYVGRRRRGGVVKSWKKLEPKLRHANRAIGNRLKAPEYDFANAKDARNAEYLSHRRDLGYQASSHRTRPKGQSSEIEEGSYLSRVKGEMKRIGAGGGPRQPYVEQAPQRRREMKGMGYYENASFKQRRVGKAAPVSRLRQGAMPFFRNTARSGPSGRSGWLHNAGGGPKEVSARGNKQLFTEHERATRAAGQLKSHSGASKEVSHLVGAGQMHPNFGRYLEGKARQQGRAESPIARASRLRGNASRNRAALAAGPPPATWMSKGFARQSVARPIARRAPRAVIGGRGSTRGQLVATGGAGVHKGRRWTDPRKVSTVVKPLRKKEIGKARYFDPDDRRQRRTGIATGALGLAGGAALVTGGRRSLATTRKLREAGRAAVRHNKNAASVARGRQMETMVGATPRDLAYLGGGTLGVGSAGELYRQSTTRRGGRWT